MPNFNRANLSLEPVNVAINDALERAAVTMAELPRPYLGASIVGHECARRIQYDWWCKPVLVELRRPALALSEAHKRHPHVTLGGGPLKRHTLARPFLQCLAKSREGIFKLSSPALALPEARKCNAQTILIPRPVEGRALARYQLQQTLTPLDGRK